MPPRLPVMLRPDLGRRCLERLREVSVPERVDGAFLTRDLGIEERGVHAFIPLATALGLLGEEGRPTPLYRTVHEGGEPAREAMAAAVREAYAPLYGEYPRAESLDEGALTAAIAQTLDLPLTNDAVTATSATFRCLLDHADRATFEALAVQAETAESEQGSPWGCVLLPAGLAIAVLIAAGAHNLFADTPASYTDMGVAVLVALGSATVFLLVFGLLGETVIEDIVKAMLFTMVGGAGWLAVDALDGYGLIFAAALIGLWAAVWVRSLG